MPSAISENEAALHEKEFFVNDGRLPPEYMGFIEPATLDTPIEEIRRRYRENGHVLVKGVLPREDVLKAREKYFEFLSPSGILAPGTNPVQGVFNTALDRRNFPGIGAGPDTIDADSKVTGPDPEAARKFGDLALGAHNEEWYKEDLCRHPALRKFVAEMTGWGENTHGLTRTLLRNNVPKNKAIGVHYDQIFLRHGDDTSLTAWVPMGDVKVDGGGLIYLEKGHDIGAAIEQDFAERARAAGFSDEETKHAYNQNMMGGGLLTEEPLAFAKEHGRRWLLTPYEAGDVVFHNPYAIHASTINHDKDNVIRLGTDLRFVDKSGNWDSVSDNPILTGTNMADAPWRAEVDRGFPLRRWAVIENPLSLPNSSIFGQGMERGAPKTTGICQYMRSVLHDSNLHMFYRQSAVAFSFWEPKMVDAVIKTSATMLSFACSRASGFLTPAGLWGITGATPGTNLINPAWEVARLEPTLSSPAELIEDQSEKGFTLSN